MYSAQDFKSDQEVRWCPGCGDHAILAAVQRTLPTVCETLKIGKEDVVFVSGIGCSSRFPYYMNTYGFHTIHGRATAISTGVKIANPKLFVWQVTGDGDALAIGGNHFIHAIRRNVNLNVLLFNNEIYGLTKGQYSPTSKLGLVTKTSPYGTVEAPFNPGELVLGARGTFFARTLDFDVKLSGECITAAGLHKGTSVVEVLQNCIIFNDATHKNYTDKELRSERIIVLEHGKPMVFGKENNKGLYLDGLSLKVGEIGKDITMDKVLVHDMTIENPTLHSLLASMKYPDYPLALGVIRSVNAPTLEDELLRQQQLISEKSKIKSVQDLLNSGDTWEVA